MNILALDPGAEKTAWVLYGGGEPVKWDHDLNSNVRKMLVGGNEPLLPADTLLAVEYMRPRGMPTSQEELDTTFELGRMVQVWQEWRSGTWVPVSRHQVKMHVCGRATATDANIRAALIDRYGGVKAIAPARKCLVCKGRGAVGRGKARHACETCSGSGRGQPPGLLHGLTGDCWSALAVAVTAAETHASRGDSLNGEATGA